MTRTSIGTNQKYVNISLLYPPELLIKGILETQGAKTCTNMGESLEISHDVLQKIIASNIKTEKELRQLLYSLVYVNYKPGTICYLIGDDSCIVKQFANCLEGLNIVYDTAESDKTKGYKLVVLAWSNGEVTIPIDFKFWFKANGKTKLELMQEMIMEWHKRIPFYVVLLDGLYASYDMMAFFDHINIKFIMRLPKNRKVQDNKQNPAIAIGDNWRFKLVKNNKQKIFKAYIQGILRYITASKRHNRSGAIMKQLFLYPILENLHVRSCYCMQEDGTLKSSLER